MYKNTILNKQTTMISDKERIDISGKIRVEKEEMWAYYSQNYPFLPNNTRVGLMAKQLGFVPSKQMVKGKIIRFYIRKEVK